MNLSSSSSGRFLALAALLGAALCAHAAEGEVRKIDLAQGKITIKAGEVRNLDMPAMTMAYKARPVTLLNGLAEGDAITFEAAKVDGQYVVTSIKKR